jgi:hypothetical protein
VNDSNNGLMGREVFHTENCRTEVGKWRSVTSPPLRMLLNSRVIRLLTASMLAGISIGLVGSAFRYVLIAADSGRNALIAWAHAWPHLGWLLPVALALVGVAVARIVVVRFAPMAEGSGIQRVEAASAWVWQYGCVMFGRTHGSRPQPASCSVCRIATD